MENKLSTSSEADVTLLASQVCLRGFCLFLAQDSPGQKNNYMGTHLNPLTLGSLPILLPLLLV